MIVFIVSVSPSILPGLSVLGSAPGNPLTLECIVEAYPKPFVVWSFGGAGHSHVFGCESSPISCNVRSSVSQ